MLKQETVFLKYPRLMIHDDVNTRCKYLFRTTAVHTDFKFTTNATYIPGKVIHCFIETCSNLLLAESRER